MTLSFAVPYIRPGEYKAIFTVRDQNSSKSGEFEVPFTITEPVAGTGEAASQDPEAAGSAGIAAGSPAAGDGEQPQN
jgi:hypothetical protein